MQGPQDSRSIAMNKAVHASNLIISHDPGVAECDGVYGRPGIDQQRDSRSWR
jgi:hypothetical protein